MPEKSIINVSGLKQNYGDFQAVRGISLQVRDGEIFALLGTNGAGKTTTLDVLEGTRPAGEGTVRVFDVDPHHERGKIAHRIGVMLQEAGFFGELTVGETIRCWRRFTPGARPADEALELAELTHRATTPVGRLSGGEKRRLDLALALLGQPELLFLDEPTTGLDPEARRHSWKLLRALADEGMTILLTTHYMEEAEFLADRVAIMDRGLIVHEGTLDEIKSRFVSQITFRLPDGLHAADLPVLPGAEVEESPSGHITLRTGRTQETTHAVLSWAESARAELEALEVRNVSLEEVFLDVASGERAES
ncbi:ABC transporter ATP-binding protein [Nonomuraea sp. NPDC000554]|uniref:ABC transporter ATP-binding protein n=1 Tax=Nonomuraea sp. NPDC000554 TaxID=3154259 RepID=UPI003329C898